VSAMGVWRAGCKRAASLCGDGPRGRYAVMWDLMLCIRAVIVAAVLPLTICVNDACAAPTATTSVSYHGVALEVQERTQVGPDTLQISCDGEVFVVAESEAGRGVAMRLLSRPSVSLTAHAVANIATRAAGVPDGEVLGTALRVIFQRDDWVDFDSVQAWQNIVASEVGRARIVSALSEAAERKITSRACSSLRALYDFPPTLQVEALARKAAGECSRVGVQQAIRDAFLGNDTNLLAADLRRLALVFYGDAGSEKGFLPEADSALTNLSAASTRSDVRLFEDSVSRLKQCGEGLGMPAQDLDPSLLREQFVVYAADRGSFQSVFAAVPRIRGDKRTPAVHAAVLRALDGISADKVAESITTDAQAALQVFAEKDEEIALRNQMTVQRGVEYCLAHGQPEEAFRLLRGARNASGALPEKLAELVSQVVQEFLDQSQRERAEEVVTVFNHRLGVFTRLNLYLSRFGLSLRHVVSALVILVVCGVAWCIRKRKGVVIESRVGAESQSNQRAAAAETSSASKPQTPSEELVRALASFGLEPGATLSEIKNAYRARVKECHPDRNPDAPLRDNNEFVQLTTQYELLLALYQREPTADK
jgi:hypothetical protein